MRAQQGDVEYPSSSIKGCTQQQAIDSYVNKVATIAQAAQIDAREASVCCHLSINHPFNRMESCVVKKRGHVEMWLVQIPPKHSQQSPRTTSPN